MASSSFFCGTLTLLFTERLYLPTKAINGSIVTSSPTGPKLARFLVKKAIVSLAGIYTAAHSDFVVFMAFFADMWDIFVRQLFQDQYRNVNNMGTQYLKIWESMEHVF